MSYEIEIKTLLGEKENADAFRDKLLSDGDNIKTVGQSKQLNHYFVGGKSAIESLYDTTKHLVPEDQQDKFYKITHGIEKYSVRTREIDGKQVILVIKASIDDTTSENGIARMEVEVTMPMSLDELDKMILDAGFEYQAKWSREREEYQFGDITITLDKNAGYGYLAEFEKVIEDEGDAKDAEQSVRAVMVDFGLEELRQDRLARMFDFYNKNWRDYYGTEKVFTIE